MHYLSSHPQRTGFVTRAYLALLRFLGGLPRQTPPGRYRPEKHYMRGPGPKSRKNSSTPEQGPKRS